LGKIPNNYCSTLENGNVTDYEDKGL